MYANSDESLYIDFTEPILKRQHRLPHWQQPGKLYFITFHLADSLPQEKLDQWRTEKDAWTRMHPEPWDDAAEDEYHRLFSDRIDEYLDAGSGACILRQSQTAEILAATLHFFDTQRYKLYSFAIMPNHVHVLVWLFDGQDLAKVLHSWKSYSAKRINQALGGKGILWQEDYWDRMIRSDWHFLKVLSYIRENPERAQLRPGEYLLYESDCQSRLQCDE